MQCTVSTLLVCTNRVVLQLFFEMRRGLQIILESNFTSISPIYPPPGLDLALPRPLAEGQLV